MSSVICKYLIVTAKSGSETDVFDFELTVYIQGGLSTWLIQETTYGIVELQCAWFNVA